MRLSGRSGMLWQLEPERRAAARAVVEADVALHHLHQALADGKPEARAALLAGSRRIGLREAPEHAAAEVLRDPGAAVVDADAQMRAALLERDVHGLAYGGELGGVGEEVGHDLNHALAIGVHLAPGQAVARAEAYLEPLAESLVEHHGLAHDLVQREDLGHHCKLARLDLLDVENVVDEIEKPLAVALGHRGELRH